MKKVFLVMVLFLIGFTVLSAQETPSITIVNNTGSVIIAIRIRQAGTNSWTVYTFTNNETIKNGQSVSVQLPNHLNSVNQYVIILEESDSTVYTKRNVLVSSDARIEFITSDFDEDYFKNYLFGYM
jgi:hypothetical protein